jgi:hypothetical protein
MMSAARRGGNTIVRRDLEDYAASRLTGGGFTDAGAEVRAYLGASTSRFAAARGATAIRYPPTASVSVSENLPRRPTESSRLKKTALPKVFRRKTLSA